MKTTKEFPATHSMSTQWFIVDEEGNLESGRTNSIYS